VVGATCAGKTTLVDAVRAAALPGVTVPPRFVTRPPRAGDHPAETVARTPAAFDDDVAGGAIDVHWTRRLEADRVERYGFAPVPPDTLPVYSANNAILDALGPAAALCARALIVGVIAPDALRAERLRARSPDLCRDRPAEVALRLAEPGEAIADRVDVVVHNHGDRAAHAAAALIALVAAAARRG
jgi:ribose 1,5-bisphosphokinase PhnN